MQVRINQLAYLVADRTFSAGVRCVVMPAVEVLEKCQCQGKSPAAFILVENHGMRDSSAVSHADKRPLHISVAYDIPEPHDFLIDTKSAISASIATSAPPPRALSWILAFSTYSASFEQA